MRHEVTSSKSLPAHSRFGILHCQDVHQERTPLMALGLGNTSERDSDWKDRVGQSWEEVNWRHSDSPQGTARDTREAKLENGAATEGQL